MDSGLKDLLNKVESMEKSMNALSTTWKEQKSRCVTLQKTASDTQEVTNIMEILFVIFKQAIEETNEDKRYFLEKLKSMNEIAEAMGEYLSSLNETTQNNAKSGEEEETPESRTLVRIVRDVDRATQHLNVAINAAGKSKLPRGKNLQKTLKELKSYTGKANKTIQKFKKEREKKEKEKKRQLITKNN